MWGGLHGVEMALEEVLIEREHEAGFSSTPCECI